MFENIVNLAVQCYVHILQGALPVALVIGLSGVLVNMILTAGFTGRLQIGGGDR